MLLKNLQALASASQNMALVEKVRAAQPATDIGVLETPDGGITIEYRGICLHDPAGALTEAKSVSDTYCKPRENGLHVILGLGLGYLLREVAASTTGHRNSRILIYEPHLDLLRFVLDNVDLSDYFADGRVWITDEPVTFYQMLQTAFSFGKTGVDIIALPAYTHLMRDEIRPLLDRITKVVEGQKISVQVGMLLNKFWIQNFIANIPVLPSSQPLDELADRYQGKPAVIVSSGPSLDAAIPQLKALANRAVIIAVGRSLRPLMQAGIQPDFAVFLDYEGPAAHLRDLPESTADISFILGPFAERCAFEVPAKHRFLASLFKYPNLTTWLDDTLGRKTHPVDVEGTVSYMGMQAAYLMGCNPIILAGQDLALQADSHYAAGSGTTQTEIDAEGHLIMRDSESFSGTRLKLVDVQGQNGDMLKTTPDYLLFKGCFESFAELSHHREPERRLINASLGGAMIDGFELASVETALADCPAFDKAAVLSLLDSPNASQQHQHAQLLQEGVSRMLTATQQCQTAIAEALDLLQQATGNPLHGETVWQQVTPRYNRAQDNFKRQIEAQPILASALGNASWEYNQAIQPNATTWTARRENLLATVKFFEVCQEILGSELRPYLDKTLLELKQMTQTNAKPMQEISVNAHA